MADLIIRNAAQILTCAVAGVTPPLAGQNQSGIGLTAGSVAVEDGRIVAIGEKVDKAGAKRVIDARGGVVTPGFVDCHTHAVFHGSRADEFEMRAKGVGYQAIARRGGGIQRSMTQLRDATDEELRAAVMRHLDAFLDLGTTTIEAKSGYGLSLEDELRSLRALDVPHKVEVVRTCLAAHSVPPEFKDDRRAYVKLVCEEIFPAVQKERLAQFCDVFVEKGVFSFEESQRVLEAGQRHGLRGRVHADQLSRSGGARLACRIGAATADHLEFATREDAVAMREAGVTAVLLPAANYILDQPERPPARGMITMQCPVAVATDFNPGSAPTQSMPLTLNLACVRFGMSVAEAIVGATINAACTLGLQDRIGSIELGKQADLLVFDVPDYREIAYWFGADRVRTVIKKGEVVRER